MIKRGIHEERTRIVLYLPYNSPGEAAAYNDFITYLQGRKLGASNQQGQISGFTQSRNMPASFEGWWWSDTSQSWIHDKLVLVIIDHEFPITDPRLHTEVDDLKQTLGQFYSQNGSPQEEIWVVSLPVWRYD